MNRALVQVIAQVAVFLEFADDATLDPDAAVKQQDDMAFQLQQLPAAGELPPIVSQHLSRHAIALQGRSKSGADGSAGGPSDQRCAGEVRVRSFSTNSRPPSAGRHMHAIIGP